MPRALDGQTGPARNVAAQIADQEQCFDVLINNAGALFARRRLTPDGFEFTFALNHMAYFVMPEGLRERLIASRPAHHQHGFRRASGRHLGFRRSSIEEELPGLESLWSLETVQHPIYA